MQDIALRNKTKLRTIAFILGIKILTIELYPAFCRSITDERIKQSCFTSSAASNDGNELTRQDAQINIIKDAQLAAPCTDFLIQTLHIHTHAYALILMYLPCLKYKYCAANLDDISLA